jgi:hypothetical protein
MGREAQRRVRYTRFAFDSHHGEIGFSSLVEYPLCMFNKHGL